MKAKKLIILSCAAALLVAVAILTSDKGGSTAKTNVQSEQLFKDLPVNDVTRIEIITATQVMRVQRGEDGWFAPDKFGYPAKFDRIKEALISLTEMKAGDERKLNDEQRLRAKMISPANKEADDAGKGSLVRVYTSGSGPAATLLIGSQRQTESATPGAGAMGTFVSPDEGKTILLTSEFMGYLQNADPSAWLNTEILSVNSFNITNITIQLPDEEPLTLYSDGQRDLTMDRIPRKHKLDADKARTVRFSLSYLRYAEVADPALDNETMGFGEPSTFTAATSEGELYTVTLGGKVEGRDDRYLRAAAEFIGTIPAAAEGEDEKAREAREKLEETRKKVESINERLRKWTYVVPASSVESMLFTRDDLIVQKDD